MMTSLMESVNYWMRARSRKAASGKRGAMALVSEGRRIGESELPNSCMT